METGELILTDAVLPPNLLTGLSKIEQFSDEQTTGQMGLDEDAGGKAVRDLFWLYLGRHISSNGGFGMWKDIYRRINNSQTNSTQQLDKSI